MSAATFAESSNPLNPPIIPVASQPSGDLAGKSVQDLQKELISLQQSDRYKKSLKLAQTMPQYRDAFTAVKIAGGSLGATLVTASLIAFATLIITAVISHFTGCDVTFSHVINWVQLHPWNAAMAGGMITVLLGGASIVIHKALTKKDARLESGRGHFGVLNDHLETAEFGYKIKEKNIREDFYIDTSTLDAHKNGKAFIYRIKTPAQHYSVSVEIILGTPFIVVGTIVYNIFRAVIIPFYITFQAIKERCLGLSLSHERMFKLTDIPKEMIKSVNRVVKAPFYGLALMFAAVYTLVNPMGGRKLGSAIERDWNEEVTLSEGFWSIGGPQSLFQWEGGGSPNGLGRNGYYLAGCWQPVGIVEYQNGTILDAYYMPKAIDLRAGVNYTVITRTEMETVVAEEETQSLLVRAEAIDKKIAELKASASG